MWRDRQRYMASAKCEHIRMSGSLAFSRVKGCSPCWGYGRSLSTCTPCIQMFGVAFPDLQSAFSPHIHRTKRAVLASQVTFISLIFAVKLLFLPHSAFVIILNYLTGQSLKHFPPSHYNPGFEIVQPMALLHWGMYFRQSVGEKRMFCASPRTTAHIPLNYWSIDLLSALIDSLFI